MVQMEKYELWTFVSFVSVLLTKVTACSLHWPKADSAANILQDWYGGCTIRVFRLEPYSVRSGNFV